LKNTQSYYSFKIDGFELIIRPLLGLDLEIFKGDSDNQINSCNIPNEKGDLDLLEVMLRKCIVKSEPQLPDSLSEEFMKLFSTELEKIDPYAETILSLDCVECRKHFKVPFDVEGYFFEEMSSRISQLEHDIHWIALNYHWDEGSILSLPMIKRKRYVEMINESMVVR